MNILEECHYRVSIKALIADKEDKFLLIKEENGLWELPGGGLDHGEKTKDCLKREIKEEMGLEVVEIEEQPSYFFSTTNLEGKPIINVVYKTKLNNLNFTPSSECVEIKFFSFEEAKKLENTFNNIKEFLKVYSD